MDSVNTFFYMAAGFALAFLLFSYWGFAQGFKPPFRILPKAYSTGDRPPPAKAHAPGGSQHDILQDIYNATLGVSIS